MSKSRLLKVAAVLLGASLFTSPVSSQHELEGGRWRVLTCNTDGTYTCIYENCLTNCCPL
ncbi:MAG TPA: hypothetical protein VF632_07530 [Longimicrobium sp.]|jgi:hypothetical protein